MITGIFFVLALFGLLNHEMWRDEHQAWLIARDAHSLSQVFENMKYEGNPALWHICLYFITCFTDNPLFMQAFHLLIACSFIFIFNRYAPLGNFYKILFSFGYFPLYEYAVISRSYGLGILLIFIACVLYKKRQSNYILLGIILALLANVTIYGAIISLAIAGILLLDYFFHQQKNDKEALKLLAGLSVFLAGFVLSMYQIWPEKDNTFPTPYATQLFELPRWAFVASKFFTTYFYVPDIQPYFWNTNIFANPPFPASSLAFWVFMPCIIFLLGLISFLKKPLVLLLYAGATLCLISVYYYTAMAHSRYCGHLLIVLIICYWLAEYYPEKKYNNAVFSALSGLGKKINKPLLAIILLFNFAGVIVAYAMDFQYKFSPSKDAAEYIRQNKLDTLPMAGMTDFTASPLSTYLNKKIYYPQMKDFGSFVIWNKKRSQMTFRQMVDNIDSFMRQGRTKILLTTDMAPQITKDGKNFIPLEQGMITNDLQLILLKTFDGGIVNDEKYYIYTAQRVDSTKVDFNKYPRIN